MNTIDNRTQQTDALAPLQAAVDHFTRQHADAAAQSDSIAGQIKAAVRRGADLQQQLTASMAELGKLGFMQLGKKMLIKAEQDSIHKKITANQQLRDSLLARQEACLKQQAELAEQLAAARAALEMHLSATVPAEPEAPPMEPAELPAEEASTAAESPAKPQTIPAAPKRSAAKKPRTSKAPRTARNSAAVSALPLEEQISLFLTRLEAFYPEHQVFALDSISSELRDRMKLLAERSGCACSGEFLQKQGWQLITGAQGRALRSGKYCTPGQEPEVIRPLVASMLRRLEKHYPDRVILRSIQHDHKSLSQDVSGLYQWLGYASTADMLNAYGYQYQVTAGGRPATDAQTLINALKAAYASGEKPRTIARITADHPEYARHLKTLQNQAPARFGMPMRQYLREQGILAGKDADEA